MLMPEQQSTDCFLRVVMAVSQLTQFHPFHISFSQITLSQFRFRISQITGVCKYYIGPIGDLSLSTSDCHSRRLGIYRQHTHSLHRNDMAYCHFELCRDCGLGCFSESLLADIRMLSVAAVEFLYQITVFLQQNTTTSLLELYFNDSSLSANCVCARWRRRWQSTNWDRRWGRCSIYRHRQITQYHGALLFQFKFISVLLQSSFVQTTLFMLQYYNSWILTASNYQKIW